MLFNSYAFIYLFLPITFVGFVLCGRLNRIYAVAWLAFASLFFYGYFNPKYVLLLLCSVLFNFCVGTALSRMFAGSESNKIPARYILVALGISANLALLGYFKYANFFVENLDRFVGFTYKLDQIVLPLGISFFTFTQIAFLVDAYQGKAKEYNLLNYLLFVTYFPHLVAGPILHHRQLMPQFEDSRVFKLNLESLAIGGTMFAIGLFKKVVIADSVGQYVGPVFDSDGAPTLVVAWTGVLAYALQIYFDFSGYSDMAVGLSKMIGVEIPLNFQSPYKATSIIEFWRRWHISLSTFLRDYLYIPMGGNRRGRFRRYGNLLITMLLGGLWHGAGWTFVVWGGLHGAYLVVNNLWRGWKKSKGLDTARPSISRRLAAWLLTFLAVLVAWVFFRAPNLSSALSVLSGLFGMNGLTLPSFLGSTFADIAPTLQAYGIEFTGTGLGFTPLIHIALALCIALIFPNSNEIVGATRESRINNLTYLGSYMSFKPNLFWSLIVAALLSFSLRRIFFQAPSEFIYYNF